MNRRDCLKTAGIAAGVFASGATGVASAGSTEIREDRSQQGRVNTVNDLLELSEEELWKLPNEEVRRPFSAEIGSGRHYDADEWEAPEGRPHGGTVTRSDATVVARTKAELQAALANASEGDVVWIPGDVTIDALGPKPDEKGSYYGRTPFVVPAGVTVASDRGQQGSEGAAFVKERPDRAATMRIVGDGARVTGLRFVGPEPEYYEVEDRGVSDGNIYDVGVSAGVWVEGPSDYGGDPVSGDSESVDDVEIDNCHFSGFIYHCVRFGGLAYINSPPTTGGYVHHCEMVDTPSPGLGYGVTVQNAEPVVEFCYFDNNRHAIAGHGGETMTSYTFQHNLMGPRTRSHVIDCHGGPIDGYEHDVAGDRLTIRHNLVMATTNHLGHHGSIVDIRGIPAELAEISYNWFFSDRVPPLGDCSDPGESSDVIDQWGIDGGFEGLWVHNNLMGKFDPHDTIGVDGRWEPDTGHGTGRGDD